MKLNRSKGECGNPGQLFSSSSWRDHLSCNTSKIIFSLLCLCSEYPPLCTISDHLMMFNPEIYKFKSINKTFSTQSKVVSRLHWLQTLQNYSNISSGDGWDITPENDALWREIYDPASSSNWQFRWSRIGWLQIKHCQRHNGTRLLNDSIWVHNLSKSKI